MLVDLLLPSQPALLIALMAFPLKITDPCSNYYFVKFMLVDLLLPGQPALLIDHPCPNYYFVKVMLVVPFLL